MAKEFTKSDLEMAFDVFRMRGFPHNEPTFEKWFEETFSTPKEPETVQGHDEKGVDNFIPPDHGDMCWQIGAKNFSRKEVAYLLYTQRAMIGNDLKAHCGNEMTDEMFKILSNPRTPNY